MRVFTLAERAQDFLKALDAYNALPVDARHFDRQSALEERAYRRAKLDAAILDAEKVQPSPYVESWDEVRKRHYEDSAADLPREYDDLED